MRLSSESSKPEPISLDDIVEGHRDFSAELWAPIAERVKLAPLAARIDAWGQFRQELIIVLPPNELLVQLFLGPRKSG
jgi:hypothetical protein